MLRAYRPDSKQSLGGGRVLQVSQCVKDSWRFLELMPQIPYNLLVEWNCPWFTWNQPWSKIAHCKISIKNRAQCNTVKQHSFLQLNYAQTIQASGSPGSILSLDESCLYAWNPTAHEKDTPPSHRELELYNQIPSVKATFGIHVWFKHRLHWCIRNQAAKITDSRHQHQTSTSNYRETGGSGRLAHPRSDELDAAEERGGVGVLLRHVRLVGPDPTVQPRQQVNVVGDPPRELLRRVHVRVHEP
jgi:hypothetical protein